MAALVRAAGCQTGVTQWIAACSGLLQTTGSQGQCRRMLCGVFQRHKAGQFRLSKSCGGLIKANGAITQQNRSFYNTNKHLSAKDSLQPSEEKVGTFTRIIEAMGFTGPLKYSRWKIKVAALRMYTCCVEKTDYEEFFNRCQMPDTLNSWFLVAQLHVWMCLVRMKQEGRTGKYMCRYIVHCMWEDVEQRGKVMGINSVALKEDLRSMVENFYAALFGYDEGILSDDHVLAAALWRNLFNKNCEDPRHLELLVEYVRKQVIAIVMDLFTDMEILCDLLEASSRRHVPVYLILDEEYLKHFVEMCNKMALTQDNFPNMRIRCLSGDTYYSKAGKKFAGQVLEKFILIDCDQVLAGTYSFTWLCSQVHTSLVTHFRGQIVAEFDKEFRYLYAESRAVTSFCVPDPGMCPSSQNTSKVANSLLKSAQVNDAETLSPSSSLSNVSIRSIKMSPFLKNSSCNVHQEKQDSNSDSCSKKGKEDTSLKPACPKQQGEPPDSPNSPPNISTPAFYHKSNLMTARTFLQPEPSPAPSSNKPSYQGDNKANSSHCSPQEQTVQSPSEGAGSNGTSMKPKGPAATSQEPTAENDTTFYGMEKRQSPRQGKLDLLSPYNQLKRDKKPVVSCYDKLTEDMLMEKNSAYGAEKRMTLGHSKLDLITKYNKLKSKHIHSRFEL